eukprot:gene7131-7935_t
MVNNSPRLGGLIPPGAVHLIAGGLGATIAAVSTCPLEVVQTRLQSSILNFTSLARAPALKYAVTNHVGIINLNAARNMAYHLERHLRYNYLTQLFSYMRFMVKNEGATSLFKGLFPSAVGVAPAKSLYFLVYSQVKTSLNDSIYFQTDTRPVFTIAAVCAGLTTSTFINPVWFIKTQLQLDHNKESLTVNRCIQNAYKQQGYRAFFRGMTASYVGVFETIIYFIIYEDVKKRLKIYRGTQQGGKFHSSDYVLASVLSKLSGTLVMYPHEVMRTRLREDTKIADGRLKYRNIFQTFLTVAREEGFNGLYGGFGTNIMRQVPSTAITFLAYEAIINFFEVEQCS